MMIQKRAAVAMIWVLLTVSGASAQEDAWVLPFGTMRIGASGAYSHWDDRFGEGGWAGLLGPLDATAFAPLSGLRSGLDELMAAMGGDPVDPRDLTFGAANLRLSGDVREVPMEMAIGVLPRVQLGVTVPIQRSEVTVTRFTLSEGMLGANPDPDANAAAFSAAGPEFEALGRSPFLPLASSPLGEELTRRLGTSGSTPTLPTVAAGDSVLNLLLAQAFGVEPIRGRLSPWRLGDTRVDARVLLVSTVGAAALPTGSRPLGFRATAFGGVRLPTGTRSDSVRLYEAEPEIGLTGWHAGIAADLFLGASIWLHAAASRASVQPVDVVRRVAEADRPLATTDPPREVRWSPPSETRLTVSPRAILEESISVGLEYQMLRLGESRFGPDEGVSVMNQPGGTLQRLGGSVRFSSLQRWMDGGDVLPFEASLSYVTDVSGPGGSPDGAVFTVTARLHHRFWGN